MVVLGTAAAGGPWWPPTPHHPPPAPPRRCGLAGAGRGGRCTQRGRSGRPLRPCWAGPFPGTCSAAARMRRSRPTSLPATGPLGITARGGSSACSGWVTGWPGPHTAVEQVLILACLAGC